MVLPLIVLLFIKAESVRFSNFCGHTPYMDPLHIKIGVVSFDTPIFVSSGTFGYGQEASDLVDLEGIGAIITKSIGATIRQGNPSPRIFETTACMLNSIGLQNVGVKVFVQEKLPFLRGLGTRTI